MHAIIAFLLHLLDGPLAAADFEGSLSVSDGTSEKQLQRPTQSGQHTSAAAVTAPAFSAAADEDTAIIATGVPEVTESNAVADQQLGYTLQVSLESAVPPVYCPPFL